MMPHIINLLSFQPSHHIASSNAILSNNVMLTTPDEFVTILQNTPQLPDVVSSKADRIKVTAAAKRHAPQNTR